MTITNPLDAVHAIADGIIGHDELDACDAYQALAPLLPVADRVTLALALDLCPEHGCDRAICADDLVVECLGGIALAPTTTYSPGSPTPDRA